MAAIHKVALEEDFETGWREENYLTDAELNLFWDQLSKKPMANVENWKQHFVAWLLVWVTSSRPSSFTPAYGYEAGSSVATGIYRNMADTLRWRDLSFVRVPESEGDGNAVKEIWRHQKGFRVPHKQQQTSGNQKFNIMPLKDNTYRLDLALLLVFLAFSRGLFHYETLYELFNGTELNIQQVDEVADRAVFLTSNQSGTLNPTEPMHEKAPNAKLREMCDLVAQHNLRVPQGRHHRLSPKVGDRECKDSRRSCAQQRYDPRLRRRQSCRRRHRQHQTWVRSYESASHAEDVFPGHHQACRRRRRQRSQHERRSAWRRPSLHDDKRSERSRQE